MNSAPAGQRIQSVRWPTPSLKLRVRLALIPIRKMMSASQTMKEPSPGPNGKDCKEVASRRIKASYQSPRLDGAPSLRRFCKLVRTVGHSQIGRYGVSSASSFPYLGDDPIGVFSALAVVHENLRTG